MEIKLGIYEHYKGGRYKVLMLAKLEETHESMVVYQALYGDESFWVRPLAIFQEDVEVDGKKVPRFRFIENESK